jgi:hypothetical protein
MAGRIILMAAEGSRLRQHGGAVHVGRDEAPERPHEGVIVEDEEEGEPEQEVKAEGGKPEVWIPPIHVWPTFAAPPEVRRGAGLSGRPFTSLGEAVAEAGMAPQGARLTARVRGGAALEAAELRGAVRRLPPGVELTVVLGGDHGR